MAPRCKRHQRYHLRYCSHVLILMEYPKSIAVVRRSISFSCKDKNGALTIINFNLMVSENQNVGMRGRSEFSSLATAS